MYVCVSALSTLVFVFRNQSFRSLHDLHGTGLGMSSLKSHMSSSFPLVHEKVGDCLGDVSTKDSLSEG